MYKSCQYNWYLQYLKGNKRFEPSLHLIFGTSIHETLQMYLEMCYSQSGAAADRLDLIEFFKSRMLDNYKEAKDQNPKGHFTTPKSFNEFIQDGIKIIEYFKKKRGSYFNLKNEELVGVEIPITDLVVEDRPKIFMIGSIDLIMKCKITGEYTIYDLKTSTNGWKDKDKKDQTKINQILFYKHFYSKKLRVDPEMIQVKFLILKKKLYENVEFPIKRIQEFVPAQGKTKMKQAVEDLQTFVRNVFTSEGEYIDKVYLKNTDSCKWCPFKDDETMCDKKNI